jgi:hypothetical protein
MPTQIAPVVYCPDLDSRNIPGSAVDMKYWAPLRSGFMGSVGIVDLWTTVYLVTLAKTFRSVSGGTARFIVFGDTTIDEYSATGTKTNRGTGYTTGNLGWSATQWGDQIIATNYSDAPQSSTGAGFTALSGSPPKARLVASNINFVMLADTNDGVAAYADEVFWSGIQNPVAWTPSLATQCGRIRLLDAPGPITQLVAFRDKFYAFKENSIFVGEYVGPPYFFQWRLISSRIGACGYYNQGVTECNDRLYFAHASGLYEFDGAQLRNVGEPVWRTILDATGFGGNPKTGTTGAPLSTMRLVVEDVEGVVWLMAYTLLSPNYIPYTWGYNTLTGKWAAVGEDATSADLLAPATWVQTTTSDMRKFLGSAANAAGRVWRVSNVYTPSKLQEFRYPADWTVAGSLTTGLAGSIEQSTTITGLQYRIVFGSDATPFASCSFNGYATETKLTNATSASGAVNADLDRFDVTHSARFHNAVLTGTVGETCILAGIGLEVPPRGVR